LKLRKRLIVEIKGDIVVENDGVLGARIVALTLDEPAVLGMTARFEDDRGDLKDARCELRIEATRATFSPVKEKPTSTTTLNRPSASLPVKDKPPTDPETKNMRAVDDGDPLLDAPSLDAPSVDAPSLAPFDWPYDQGKTTVSKPFEEWTTERQI